MNPTHVHLMITHLPAFGSIIGAFVLVYGLSNKSVQAAMASYYVLLVSAIGGVIAYLTGEPAEETIENIQGISDAAIEEHEEFAQVALVSVIILGILALVALILNKWKPSWRRMISIIVLIVAIASFGLTAWTGLLGGKIRHTEIANGLVQPTYTIEHEDD